MTLSHEKPFSYRDFVSDRDSEFNDASTKASSDRKHQARTSCPPNSPPSDSPDDISIGFLPPQRPWQKRLPIALAGGTAIATSLGLVYLEGTHPKFEGRVQLQPHRPSVATSIGIPTDPTTETSGQSAIATPESLPHSIFSHSQQSQFLTTTILPRVAEQLQAQGINLSTEQLSKQIDVAWNDARGLEITYQSNDADVVSHVLRAIAQTYETQTGNCVSQTCQDARYIQAQIPSVEREVVRLQTELKALRHQHQIVDLNRQHRELEATVHEFFRIQQASEQELAAAQADLAQQQDALGLAPDSTTAQVLLERSPYYAALLNQWAEIDQQIVNNSLKQDAADQRDSADQQIDVTQHYERLSHQIFSEARGTIDGLRLYEMPSELRHAIINHPMRLEALHDWLKQAQRVQLLTLRRNHLAQTATQLEARVQQWRSLLSQHRRLEAQISVARQTLMDYRERYARLQQLSLPQQVAWQPIAPPDVMPLETPLGQAAQWFTQRFAEAAHAHEIDER